MLKEKYKNEMEILNFVPYKEIEQDFGKIIAKNSIKNIKSNKIAFDIFEKYFKIKRTSCFCR